MSEGETDGSKPKMPRVLRELGEKASQRHGRRSATPQLKITATEGTWWFCSPYQPADESHWVALMFDAFATRSQGTFRTFMIQLSNLCSTAWNEEADAWHPNEDELIAAVQIVRAIRPRNEAEACLAAQMVAVHLMQMKLSAECLSRGWAEPRTCGTAGKLARTYAMQLETIAKLRGRASRQRITVRKFSQHEHKHIHLHQGGEKSGNQPYGPKDTRRPEIREALQLESVPTLLGQDPAKDRLPEPCEKGKEAMPATRRRGRGRSAER